MVLYDLEHLLGSRDPTRLQLRPDRNIIECDLECSGGDELTLDGVTDEENHHAGVYLVIHGPGVE